MPAEASGVYVVDRWKGGTAAGHWGTLSFRRLDEHCDFTGNVHVDDILGEDIPLHDGTIIKVTVEVVKQTTESTVSPWHDGEHHTHGHYANTGTHYGGSHNEGDPWGCKECHKAAGCCDG